MTPERAILLPGAAMAALTLAVWLRMYATRIEEMRRERIDPQSVATSAQLAARLTDSAAADNFRNLFELPVLFYAALVTAAIVGAVDAWTLGLAWAFVVLRIVHSGIQCTSNRVMHRFAAYSAGAVVLWALWAALGWHLLRG